MAHCQTSKFISGIPCLANMDFNARIVSLDFWDASSIKSFDEAREVIHHQEVCPSVKTEQVGSENFPWSSVLELKRVSMVRYWVFDAQYICDS